MTSIWAALNHITPLWPLIAIVITAALVALFGRKR